jgi:hypothetical protein
VSTLIGRSGQVIGTADHHAEASRQVVQSLTESAAKIGSVRRPHPIGCGPDQSARAQRYDRGGARRRGRTRFCGGGERGQGSRRTDVEGHR